MLLRISSMAVHMINTRNPGSQSQRRTLFNIHREQTCLYYCYHNGKNISLKFKLFMLTLKGPGAFRTREELSFFFQRNIFMDNLVVAHDAPFAP